MGKTIVGIPQIGNKTYYIPPYIRMVSTVWKPTFPTHPSCYWDRFLNRQPTPSSQIPIHPSSPQQAQIHVSQPLQVFIESQPIPTVSGASQIPLTLPIKGSSCCQLLGQGTPQLSIGKFIHDMLQYPQNHPYNGTMKTPNGKQYGPYQVPFQG